MKKTIRIGLFLLFGFHAASAQISLQVFNYRPTGIFGFVMKPLVSAELGYQGKFEDGRFRSNFSVTYLHMKTRQDTFPESGVLIDNGTHITPGYESYSKYNILQVASGADFAFIKKDKWAVFAGADLLVGFANVDYHNVDIMVDETYSGGGLLAGFRGRLGAEYTISDHISVYFAATRSYFLITEPAGLFSANTYGFGTSYDF
jgi:hypothetical protein